jgi:thiol-disulfide isomerase/thioredoxin
MKRLAEKICQMMLGLEHCQQTSIWSILGAVPLLLLFSCTSIGPLKEFPYPEKAPTGNEEGMRFPNLLFQDEQGKVHQLREYRGKVVFLNFSASWCPPCRREMPAMQRLYDLLKTQEIVFLLLNAKEDFDTMKTWLRSSGYTMPAYSSLEKRRSYLPLADGGTYFVRTIPETYLLDRNGIIIKASKSDLFMDHWAEPIHDFLSRSSLKKSTARSVPSPGVNIAAEISERNGGAALRLRLYPMDGVKLSAKLGITVSQGEDSGVRWLTPMPVVHKENDKDYFGGPQELTLLFVSSVESTFINLKVEYGYCVDNGQCFLSEKVINLP